jgi:hypothetical protein
MSSDLSAEITSIATVALAVLAIVAAAFAFLAYRRQSQEVALLAEANQREANERRKAQAARIYAGPSPREVEKARRHRFSQNVRRWAPRPWVKNASQLPIFDIQFWDVRHTAKPPPLVEVVLVGTGPSMLMPGEQAAIELPLVPVGQDRFTIFTFRDSAGVRWIRLGSGRLQEQTSASEHDSIVAALWPVPRPSFVERKPGPFQGRWEWDDNLLVWSRVEDSSTSGSKFRRYRGNARTILRKVRARTNRGPRDEKTREG